MAFCDNPKCRWKDCSGASIRYMKSGNPRVFSSTDPIDIYASIGNDVEVEVRTNFHNSVWSGGVVSHMFCDECIPLVDDAERELKHIIDHMPHFYSLLLQDHGENLLLHFVQSEWCARENTKKKSSF